MMGEGGTIPEVFNYLHRLISILPHVDGLNCLSDESNESGVVHHFQELG